VAVSELITSHSAFGVSKIFFTRSIRFMALRFRHLRYENHHILARQSDSVKW